MTARALRPEELAGLALAALGHAGLVWVLVNAKPPAPLPPVERVSVTLSEEVGAVSTSPDPAANPEADKGPVLGEPAPEPEAVPQAKPEPVPQPKATTPPPPRPVPSQAAKAPPPKAAPPQPAPRIAAAPKAPPAKSPPARAGASSFSDAFSGGIPGGTGKAKNPPAAQASAQQVASWSSAIGSKVRGPWNSCPVSGLDVGKLRASVRFTLAPDGRLASIEEPVITGITDANQPQVKPFRDCAIRAIRLAAPFTGLPPEFHEQWKNRRLNFRKE